MKALQQYDSPTAISFNDLERMATAIARSGLFGVKEPSQAIALCLIAQAEGLHPAIAARDYNVIQGRPAKTSEAIQRAFQAAGGAIDWHALTDEIADATFTHPQGGEFRCTWDMARARTAGLGGKDMWKKYPRAMLRARCVSEGCRTVYPGSTSGMYTPEEIKDMPEKEVTGEVVDMRRNQPTQPPRAEPPIGSGTPAHKALEARINELGLNRDGVKVYVARQFNVEHFPDLTAPQQRELMLALPGLAVKKLLKQIGLMNALELDALIKTPPAWLQGMESDRERILEEADQRLTEIERRGDMTRLDPAFGGDLAEQING